MLGTASHHSLTTMAVEASLQAVDTTTAMNITIVTVTDEGGTTLPSTATLALDPAPDLATGAAPTATLPHASPLPSTTVATPYAARTTSPSLPSSKRETAAAPKKSSSGPRSAGT